MATESKEPHIDHHEEEEEDGEEEEGTEGATSTAAAAAAAATTTSSTATGAPASGAGKKKKKNKKKKKASAAAAAAAGTSSTAEGGASAAAPTPAAASTSSAAAPPAAAAAAPAAAAKANVTGAAQASTGASMPVDPDLLVKYLAELAGVKPTDRKKGKAADDYKFWSTQPVPKLNEKEDMPAGPIDKEKTPHDIRPESMGLPPGFEWKTVTIDNEPELDELYVLLRDNYVEDDDNMFRFDYSKAFLRWALQPPGWKQVWHAGVINSSNGKLLAFISAVPATMLVNKEKELKLVEINFLCVHKKLRTKRLAPVLIQEITRRVNLEGLFQAVYTAGSLLPRPVSECTYYHRSLHPQKLIDIRFSHLPSDTTMEKYVRKYRLPEKTELPLRPMEPRDVPAVCTLLRTYLAKFHLSPVFSEEEVAHLLLPRPGVMYSYVLENADKVATDFISFYSLPSSVMKHEKYKHLSAAYSYYTVGATVSVRSLMADALILAKKENFDVFNALNLMDNQTFLEPLLFGRGDGNLRYYLFNYRLPPCKPEELGLVLV